MDLDLLRMQLERERRLEQAAQAETERVAAEQVRLQTDAAAKASADQAAADLRSLYAPKQAAFFRMGRRWKATRKTRRAGITTVGVREMLARCIETPGYRATYFAATRREAEERAWRSDTKSGLVDVLLKLAEPVDHPTLQAYKLGGITIDVREGDLVLEFSNGSEIELFGVDNQRSHRKKRGGAKHLIWIDEAQDFALLEEFFDAVIVPMSDFGIEVWMTGTPGVDCAGMFYEITKEPEEGEEPLPGWDVHTLAQVDNPFFGHVVDSTDLEGRTVYYVEDNLYADARLTAEQRAAHRYGPFDTTADAETEAVRVRWEQTAGEAMRLKGWKGDEPQFVREFLGKWVKEDARYVYPVHGVPKHIIQFAPQRLCPNPFVGTHPRFAGHPPWYDHRAAVDDLPRPKRGQLPYTWLFALYADFGYHPDPLALGVWAFCFELPDLFEMFSWKQTRVHTDDQGAYMKLLWDAIPEIVSFVGDPAGKQDDFEVWRTRMNLPIEEANKRGKNTLEEFLADDIRRHRVHLREGSPLYQEMRFLVYKPTLPGKPREVHKHRKVNGVIHGDHCADGSRYSYNDLQHFLAKQRQDKPPPGSREAYRAEEEREIRAIESAELKRAREMAEHDELAREYGGGDDAGYPWT